MGSLGREEDIRLRWKPGPPALDGPPPEVLGLRHEHARVVKEGNKCATLMHIKNTIKYCLLFAMVQSRQEITLKADPIFKINDA